LAKDIYCDISVSKTRNYCVTKNLPSYLNPYCKWWDAGNGLAPSWRSGLRPGCAIQK